MACRMCLTFRVNDGNNFLAKAALIKVRLQHFGNACNNGLGGCLVGCIGGVAQSNQLADGGWVGFLSNNGGNDGNVISNVLALGLQ